MSFVWRSDVAPPTLYFALACSGTKGGFVAVVRVAVPQSVSYISQGVVFGERAKSSVFLSDPVMYVLGAVARGALM